MRDTLHIYTDGSWHPKTKQGGWAFCIANKSSTIGEVIHKDNGWNEKTTSPRMELVAVVNSLHYAYTTHTENKKVIVYSDSRYVSDPIFFGWLGQWRAANWRNSDGQETKNSDLWEQMYQLLKRYKFRKIEVDIVWVKAHNGNTYNEICDKLANDGRTKMKINEQYE